jgi:ribonuclease HI
MISIFADGSSSGAGGGAGGYGWVIVREGDEAPIAWGYGAAP